MSCKRYRRAIRQAKANLADVRRRGKEALGSWQELARELFTPEELAEARAEAKTKAEAIRMLEQADTQKATDAFTDSK